MSAAGGRQRFRPVNLFREPVGVPMRLAAVNDLVTAASRRAGLQHAPTPIR